MAVLYQCRCARVRWVSNCECTQTDLESVTELIETNDYLQSRSTPVLWEIVVSDVVNT